MAELTIVKSEPAPAGELRIIKSQPLSQDHGIRDALKNEGFLDSAWQAIKSPFTAVKSLFNGDFSDAGIQQMKRAHELEKSGTPEQRREFAKEVLLQNIPFASTVYKAFQGNLPGAAGDVAGFAVLGGAAKGATKLPEAASAVKSVAGGALDVIGTAHDVVGAARGSPTRILSLGNRIKKGIDAYQASKTAPAPPPAPVQAANPAQFTGTAKPAVAAGPAGPVPVGLGLPPEMLPVATEAPAAAIPAGGVAPHELANATPSQFKRLSAADQAKWQAAAEKINASLQPPAAAPPQPAPIPPVPAQPPQPVPAPAPQPAPIPPQVETRSATPPPPDVATQLRDAMLPDSGAKPGQVATIGAPEPEFSGETIKASRHAAKVTRLAKAFTEQGVPYEELQNLPLNDPFWDEMAKALGETGASEDTVKGLLYEIKGLESAAKPKPKPEPSIRVRRTKR